MGLYGGLTILRWTSRGSNLGSVAKIVNVCETTLGACSELCTAKTVCGVIFRHCMANCLVGLFTVLTHYWGLTGEVLCKYFYTFIIYMIKCDTNPRYQDPCFNLVPFWDFCTKSVLRFLIQGWIQPFLSGHCKHFNTFFGGSVIPIQELKPLLKFIPLFRRRPH